MQIIEVEISKLKEYSNNPRHNENAIDAVAESIKNFGFKVPIVIDKDYVIVCGHTRYRASISLGLSEVPCIMAGDLTEEQVTAFRLVDNKTSELASWDYIALDKELRDLLESAVDLNEFGFDRYEEPDIDGLFNEESETDSTSEENEKKMMQCESCGEWFEV